MVSSAGGLNGPVTVNGGADVYDRTVAFDAPVAFDTGLVVQQADTLGSLRKKLMILLGFAAMADNPPAGMAATCNLFLQLAQSQQYWRYACLRIERWWPWQLAAGQRFYDLPVDGTDALEPRQITAAWIADNGGATTAPFATTTALALGALIQPTTPTGLLYKVTVAGNTGNAAPVWPTAAGATVVSGTVTFTAIEPLPAVWSPLGCGIDPGSFTLAARGIPTRYEVREFIEVFPTPDKPYLLYLKGRFGLRRFTDDADLATIDGDVILTFAAAMAKAHYKQPDASNYAQMAQGLARKFTAASHGTRRYIPRENGVGLASDVPPMPKATFR